MRRLVLLIGACVWTVMAVAPPAAAQTSARHALLIQGAAGEPQYATIHRGWIDTLRSLLVDRFGYDPAHVTVVAEQPAEGETRATAENVRTVVGNLAGTLGESDQLLVVFIGHGTAQGEDAKFNLIGPDLGVAEWKALLDPVKASMTVVDTTSASFPYLAGLAAPGRIVITATNSPAQQFHTMFPDAFIRALAADETDQNKDGRLSVIEVFVAASRLVREHFEQSDEGLLATETPVIDPTGDGKGMLATAEFPSNSPAALFYLDAPQMAATDDPELQKLLARQQALTDQVDDLRRRQSTMPADEYARQLEALLTELAAVSRDVRQRSE